MERKKYEKPPIVEAVFDIVTDRRSTNIQQLETLKVDGFELQNPIEEVTAGMKIEKDNPPTLSHAQETVGYRFSNAANTKVLQLKRNGMTLSLLKPYPGWGSMEESIRTIVPMYLDNVEPSKITRVALRYINRLELPRSMSDFSEYLETLPVLGRGLPQELSEMFFRVVIPSEEGQMTAIITEGIDTGGLSPQFVPLILDVDVFKATAIPSKNLTSLWETVDHLKNFRTQVFEGSLTDKTRELFN